eukprot:m.145020 g.145020  ORF g.145020 m.145020 type:complete len:161 (-) comp14935_c0_seq3:12-494(-)
MSIRISDCAEAMNMEPCESASQKRDSMMLPLRWCAPEILQDKCHTFASDVWAYGIVMYECFTAGSMPFLGMENVQVLASVIQGQVLPPPLCCPLEIYDLMVQCWAYDPRERPLLEWVLTDLIQISQRMGPEGKGKAPSLRVKELNNHFLTLHIHTLLGCQ